MQAKTTSLRTKAGAFGSLWTISDEEYESFMNTYGTLFSDCPENTKEDFENGVPMDGYRQGSSRELEQYYKIIHLLCTLGSVEKMYMPPVLDLDQSVLQNQILFEQQMAKDLNVGAGDKVLDMGCGCGAIATHIGSLTGCTMHGINIDKSQIEKAWQNPALVRDNFAVGDFNQPLKFDDESFDGAYNVQAFTYATDLEGTFREAFRVLKPGGIIVSNDVAALDNYDRDNAEHKHLIQQTHELTAFGGFWHYKYWTAALENAGFTILHSEGKSAVEMIRKEDALYEKYHVIGDFLSTIRVIPKKVQSMLTRMHQNCESYIKAEEQELLTLNWKFVAQKPA